MQRMAVPVHHRCAQPRPRVPAHRAGRVDRDDDLRQHLEEDVDRLREAIQNAFEKSGESPPVISS